MNERLEELIMRVLQAEKSAEESRRCFLDIAHDFVSSGDLNVFLERNLRDALEECDADATELVVALGIRLDLFLARHALIDALERLIKQDWHFAHEDIVSALEMVGGNDTLSALEGATRSRPPYLSDVDGGHALVRKIIWAIWKVHTPQAIDILKGLSSDNDRIISELATKQLKRN